MFVHICYKKKNLIFQTNSVPHTRPETPRSVTHNHDEDCSDEESDPIKVEEEE